MTKSILLGLFIFIIWTFPLVLNFNSSIYSLYLGDSSNLLSFNLDYKIENFNDLILSIFAPLFGNIFAFNVLVLVGFIGTYIASYIFLSQLNNNSKNNPISKYIFAGFITIAPIRLRYAMEWPDHANWTFILIYLSCAIILIKKVTFKNIIYLSLAYVGVTFNNYYHGLIITFTTLPLISLFLLYRKKFRYIFTLTCLIVAFSLPFLYLLNSSTINSTSLLSASSRNEANRWAFTARPWHYLLPDISNPLLGDLSLTLHYYVWDTKPYYLTEVFFPKEHTLYLSYGLILLTIFFLLLRFNSISNYHKAISRIKSLHDFSALFLLLCMISAFYFSMPPYIDLKIIRVYFPSQFIYSLIPQLRVYARFGLLVYICNVALAYLAINDILNIIKNKHKYLLLGIISAVIIIELLNFPPIINKQLQTPLAYDYLDKNIIEGSNVLQVPIDPSYSNVFFSKNKSYHIINSYGKDSKFDSITSEIENLSSNNQICELTKKYNVSYILNKKYDQNLDDSKQSFYKTKIPSSYLKLKISESWGNPEFGNHIALSETDRAKINRRKELSNYLSSQIALRLVYEDDKYTILMIDNSYCK